MKGIAVTLPWFFGILFMTACQESTVIEVQTENKFTDSTMRLIYTWADERNTQKLLPHLSQDHSEYRYEAAMAFASVQDTNAIEFLAILLDDDDYRVQSAAAYAMGQTAHISAENYLIKSLKNDHQPDAKMFMLEALGKCGNLDGLKLLSEMQFEKMDSLEITGLSLGLYRYAVRNVVSEAATRKLISLCEGKLPFRARMYAAAGLARAKGIDLTSYEEQLSALMDSEPDPYVRMNLALALGNGDPRLAIKRLENMMAGEPDYLVRINIVRALQQLDHEEVSMVIFKALRDENPNVGIAAAECLLEDAGKAHLDELEKEAGKTFNWRIRTLLYRSAIRNAELLEKEKLTQKVIHKYEKSDNYYEKGHYLKALAEHVMNYDFIAEETFNADTNIISTYGIEALADIRKSEHFALFAEDRLADNDEGMYEEFAEYFKMAIKSGDVTMIGTAASVLRDESLNYKQVYDSLDFLYQALNSLRVPGDIETYNELQKTIEFLNGEERVKMPAAPYNNPPDWDFISKIDVNQEAIIKTDKGDITIQLHVNSSPTSVANFIKLTGKGFYENAVFHRVVPNFVVQAGCPRGDGWGSSDETIRSEFSNLYYSEGSVGMASAGKDTESCQWFITHSPTPHLDGRYTIFATVIEGMDVVHYLEVGDRIEEIVLGPPKVL